MPFFFIALFVVGFILSIFLAPKPKIENAKAAQLSDFKFPRSQEGDPVPRIYGTVKSLGVNTIGQCNFKAVAIKKKVKTGLFSSKKVITGYKYYCGIDLAVCLGPGFVYRRMWYGNHLIWAGCLYTGDCVNRIHIDLPELLGGKDQNGGIGGYVTLYCGNFDQAQDPYLQANLTKPEVGDQITSYPGIAHMVFEDFWWGNSPNIETISVEGSFFTNGLGLPLGKYVMPNGLDANPIEVLYDICINDWGMLGIVDPIFNLGSWVTAALTCYDEGNGVSAEIANSNQAGDLFKELLRQVNGIIVQNPQTGMIDIVLIRKDYVVADLPVLGPSEISALQNFTKKLWSDTFNVLRIKYKNRDNSYQDAVATAQDFGNIRFQGQQRATEVGMPMCYVSDLANSLAARELANLNVPLYQGEIVMDRTHSDLTPGKLFVLNWPEYNIASVVMRIRKMGLGNRKSGKVSLTIVQDEFSADAVIIAPPVPPTGDGGSYSPTDIAEYVFLELPYWLVNSAGETVVAGRTQYMTFAAKPGAASLDYFAYLDDSTVADEDTEALSNAPYAAIGQTTAAIDWTDGFVTGTLATLIVGSMSDATILANGSLAALQSTGKGLFYLNGEIAGYETFVDNGDGTFTLNNVHRALMDTAPVSSAIGDKIYFFDGQEGFWDTDVPVAAFVAYLVDRSVTGRSTEAAAYHAALAPVGRDLLPNPPDYVTLGGSRALGQYGTAGSNVTFAWHERNRLTAAIDVEADATEAPEAGTTYTIEVTNAGSGAVLQTVAGIAADNDTFVLSGALAPQAAIAKVWAVKGGNRSFTAGLFPFAIITPDTLLIDGDPVLIDGSTVELS